MRYCTTPSAIGQQPADQLPWFHIVTLLTQVTDSPECERYAAQTAAQSWPGVDDSRANLANETQKINTFLP